MNRVPFDLLLKTDLQNFQKVKIKMHYNQKQPIQQAFTVGLEAFGYTSIESDGIRFHVILENKDIANDILESKDKNWLLLHVKHPDKGVTAIARYRLYGERDGYNAFVENVRIFSSRGDV
jgi:hypothetical protein